MADISVSSPSGAWTDQDCSRGSVLFQYVGNFTASLFLSDIPPTLPTGRISVSYHGLSLSGYVMRSGTTADGQCEVVVAGGAGGLWQVLQPLMHDDQPSVGLILTGPGGILSQAGESLSATSTASVLGTSLTQWPRRQDEAGYLVDDVVREAGATWRMLADGTVWVGRDAFEPATVTGQNGVQRALRADQDYTPVKTEARYLKLRAAPLGPFPVYPGQTLQDAPPGIESPRVSTVLHRDDGMHYFADVWFLDPSQPATGGEDQVTAALRGLVEEVVRQTDPYPTFHGTVVAQRGNGRLDILMDADSLPPLTNVAYTCPFPGMSVQVTGGSRVQVVFLGGDYQKPAATAYDPGAGTLTSATVDMTGTLTLRQPSPATGNVALSAVGDVSASRDLSAGRDLSVSGSAAVTGTTTSTHFAAGGLVPPTVAALAAAASASFTGTPHDAAVTVSFTPQAPPIPGPIFQVTFGTPYLSAPTVVLFPSGSPMAFFKDLCVTATPTDFTVTSGANVTGGALCAIVMG